MKNISVNTYVIQNFMKQYWPENKFVYTIQIFSGRIWSDNIVSIMLITHTSYNEYVTLMKMKFDCIEHDHKLFYRTKKQCENAIEFLDAITVMNKLMR